MNRLLPVLEKIQTVVWGPPTLLLLLATGLYFTIRLKGLQITKLGLAIKYIFQKEEGEGDVSAFASLCTALAATIGTGSIVGVATALRAGGPGALFWMWVSSFSEWQQPSWRRRSPRYLRKEKMTSMWADCRFTEEDF